MEINNYQENEESCDDVMHVHKITSEETEIKSLGETFLGKEEMEHRNNSTFKLDSILSFDSDWGESSPKDTLTDVGSNE